MCYCEFNDIIEAIAAHGRRRDLDRERALGDGAAATPSRNSTTPTRSGPGVYDIHSPRVPAVEEIVTALQALRKGLDERQIWVNPDCGLKTRGWEETVPSLRNMVAAARQMREGGKGPSSRYT